jgi:septal ring factor EnvC (AmiA/AmiB activator)
MEYVLGIFIAMGGVIFALLKINNNLRSKNKIKDIEIADAKLESEQNQIKKEKQKLQKELASLNTKKEIVSDEDVEEFWKNRKRDK